MAPNSSNLQLWEFYRVKSKEKKAELVKYCFGQNAAKTANELIVFVTRKDKWKQNAAFLLHEAKKDFPEIDFSKSLMVGDSMSDMQFGKTAGMKTAYISETPIQDALIDFNFVSLAAVAEHIQNT